MYSPEGTSRRTVEETLIDNFQDFLMGLEDEKMTGYTEMIAWSSHDYLEDEEPHQKDPVNQSVEEENPQFFHSAELTPSGVLGWLTGQRHRPVNGDDLAITVMFNYDCFEKNPNHSVCFPVVSACAKAGDTSSKPYEGIRRFHPYVSSRILQRSSIWAAIIGFLVK